MNNKIEISRREKYLLVEYSGEFSIEEAMKCIDLYIGECKKYQLRKVLLDCRKMSGQLKTIDRYSVGEYSTKQIAEEIKTALIGNAEHILPDDNFLENVVTNRGVKAKVFIDIEEATKWLLT